MTKDQQFLKSMCISADDEFISMVERADDLELCSRIARIVKEPTHNTAEEDLEIQNQHLYECLRSMDDANKKLRDLLKAAKNECCVVYWAAILSWGAAIYALFEGAR